MTRTTSMYRTWSAVAKVSLVFGIFLGVSAGGLWAEAGTFFIRWDKGGPWQVKVGYRNTQGNSLVVQQPANDVTSWPMIWGVTWPATETRPAPSTGTIQGLIITNDVDRTADLQLYDDVQRQFEECARVARIGGARPAQFQFEMFIRVDDTSTDYQIVGSNQNIPTVRIGAGDHLTCTVVIEG